MIVAPVLGGERIQINQDEFGVVTPESPIGQSMMGRGIDDEFTLIIQGKRNLFTILAIE